MTTEHSKILQKKQKILHCIASFKRKEANLYNLKNASQIMRYTLKYLSKYPVLFKNTFCAWIDFVRHFIGRCEQPLQLQCLTQISILLMYVLRIKFKPIHLIEDILIKWIELLVACPIQVTAEIVQRDLSKMQILIITLKSIGHVKYQALLVEIMIRYLLSVNEDIRLQAITKMFAAEKTTQKSEMITMLQQFNLKSLEKGIRLFLNKFNAHCNSSVNTYAVTSIKIGELKIPAPLPGQQWIDLNRGASSISFFGNSNSALWNYYEISKASVVHITRGLNLIVSISLCSEVMVSFYADDDFNPEFNKARSISIQFASSCLLEDFLAVALPLLIKNPPVDDNENDAGDGIDLNASNTTLNFSINSKVSHNELNARFSFVGDSDVGNDDVDEDIPEEASQIVRYQLRPSSIATRKTPPVPPPKRKLYSREVFESTVISSVAPPASDKSLDDASQKSLVIVMEEEELPQTKKTKHINSKLPSPLVQINKARPSAAGTSRIFKTTSNERVPIYKRVLEDWQSDGQSSYTFVNNDPPREPTRKTINKRNTRASLKQAPAKRMTRVGRSSINKQPAVKKMPLDFVRKIVRRPCKEAAQEAKKIFGLQDTPPCHGEAEREFVDEVTVNGINGNSRTGGLVNNSLNTLTLPGITPLPVNEEARNREEVTDNLETTSLTTVAERDGDDSESYAVFMKFIEEYRSLSLQLGEALQGIRKMKTKIINSARLTEYQKAGLLVELCNFLLRR